MDTKRSKLNTWFFLMTLHENNFTAVKINEAVGKRIWKVSKIRLRMWFLTNNIDSHSIEWAVHNVYKHKGAETAQYGLEIIFIGVTPLLIG